MGANGSFLPGAGLLWIASGLSSTSGTEVGGDLLKVVSVFCGLIFVVLLLLATAAMSAGFF